MIVSLRILSLIASRIAGAVSAAVSPSGTNYIFTATQLLLKNFDTGRYYLPEATWPDPDQQLKFVTEVVNPVPAGPPPGDVPVAGINYQFNNDGDLVIKHDTSGLYHRWDVDFQDDFFNILQEGQGSAVASAFSSNGRNYRFVGNTLFIKSLNDGSLHAPILRGPHGEQWLVLL